ncbi:MAG: hypothetical protein ACLRFR_01705 [Clostridia bacterium]
MKCSQCGNKNLKKTKFPAYVDASMDANAKFYCSLDSYICLNCGHYEFFSTKTIERYTSKNEEIKKIERMVFEVTKILTDIDNGLEKIKNELQELETESKNKDITIRQHEEILAKMKETKENENKLWHEWDKRIKDVIKSDKDTLQYYDWYNRQKLKKYLEDKIQRLLKEIEEI